MIICTQYAVKARPQVSKTPLLYIGGLWVSWARFDSIKQKKKKYNSYEHSESNYRLSIFLP